MGTACPCSEALRISNLQMYSYPFDWLWGGDFPKRVDIFLNEFKRYIEKEDLEFFSESNGAPVAPCAVYKNNYNGIVFNHDFTIGYDFDEIYPSVKAKYERRASRLFKQIDELKDILMVYIQFPNDETKIKDSALEELLQKIKTKYPNKNFNILYFMCEASMKPDEYRVETLNDNITKIIGNYKSKDTDAPDVNVNRSMLVSIFKNGYSLNMPFGKKIKISTLKFIIKLLPNRKFRQKLRRMFHFY